MNAYAVFRLACRVAVIVLLAMASFSMLQHEAEHLGDDLNCPVCLQAHASSPALPRQILPLVPPLVGQHLHTDKAQSGPLHRPLETHTGRAPPASIA